MSKRSMFGQRQHPLKSSYLMQRFVPTQPNTSAFIYRCSWKKDVGYKVHKITSLVGGNAAEDIEEQIQSEEAQIKPHSNSAPGGFKLIDCQALTDAYKTIQTYSTEKLKHHLSLHLSTPTGRIQPEQDSPQRGGVKLDLNSLKNQQHLLLQQQIEENFNIHQQFLVDPERKDITDKRKLRRQVGEESDLIVMQIQKQMLEVVRLANDNLLSCMGLQLKKLQCEFIQNQKLPSPGSSDPQVQVQFLKIVSYETNAKSNLLPHMNVTQCQESTLNLRTGRDPNAPSNSSSGRLIPT